MMHAQFLRIKKLTGKAIIDVAARHNHREIVAELGAEDGGRIDPARVALNRVLRGHGTAAAVARQAQTLMDAAEVKPLKRTAVMALEIIFSLPPDSSIDHDRFFNESVQWAERHFSAPVISAIIHNDEAAPHCHVLLLPLVDGRMIGSDLMGGRAKLQAMQADYHAQVGKRYGLTRQSTRKRHSAATRKQAIDSAFDVLEANSGLSAAVLLALLAPHMNDPAPLLLTLGLTMPAEKVKPKDTFAGIMTRPCKPEPNHIGIGKRNHIGIGDVRKQEKGLSLSCVGKRFSTPSFPLPNDNQASANQPTMTAAIAMQPTTSASAPTKASEQRQSTSHDDDNQPATAPPEASTKSAAASLIAVLRIPETDQPNKDHMRERDDQRAEYWDEQHEKFARPTAKASRKLAVIGSVSAALEVIRPRPHDPPPRIDPAEHKPTF
jgi:hypothetical protein